MFAKNLRAGVRGVLQLMSSIALDGTQAHAGKRGPAEWGRAWGLAEAPVLPEERAWGSREGPGPSDLQTQESLASRAVTLGLALGRCRQLPKPPFAQGSAGPARPLRQLAWRPVACVPAGTAAGTGTVLELRARTDTRPWACQGATRAGRGRTLGPELPCSAEEAGVRGDLVSAWPRHELSLGSRHLSVALVTVSVSHGRGEDHARPRGPRVSDPERRSVHKAVPCTLPPARTPACTLSPCMSRLRCHCSPSPLCLCAARPTAALRVAMGTGQHTQRLPAGTGVGGRDSRGES